MRRFIVDAASISDGYVTVSDASEIRHMKNVLRLRPEAEVLLTDGAGLEHYSKLVEYGSDNESGSSFAYFEILYTRESGTEPETMVTLYQCIPKQSKMEQIIQKSVELGVHRIVPVRSERSVPKPSGSDGKLPRWRKIAEAACKQSGRGAIPEVADYMELKDIPASAADADLILLPYEQERSVSIKSVLRQEASSSANTLALIIGPEGGFAEKEITLLKDAGAQICTLGKTILRTETAGPAALAMIFYELELGI